MKNTFFHKVAIILIVFGILVALLFLFNNDPLSIQVFIGIFIAVVGGIMEIIYERKEKALKSSSGQTAEGKRIKKAVNKEEESDSEDIPKELKGGESL